MARTIGSICGSGRQLLKSGSSWHQRRGMDFEEVDELEYALDNDPAWDVLADQERATAPRKPAAAPASAAALAPQLTASPNATTRVPAAAAVAVAALSPPVIALQAGAGQQAMVDPR
eukprot:12430036-Karenia_brevis.AAC.1